MSRTLSKKEYAQFLREQGIERTSSMGEILREAGSREEKDLAFVRHMIQEIGLFNTQLLLRGIPETSAWKQLDHRFTRGQYVKANSVRFYRVLRMVYPRIRVLLQNNRLESTPYRLVLGQFSHPGFPYQLKIAHLVHGMEFDDIATFDFDLFWRKKRIPTVVLGSMQGKTREDVEAVKRIVSQPLLLYFHDLFKEAFPRVGQRMAINSSHHPYQNPDSEYTALSMVQRGTLSPGEHYRFGYLMHRYDPQHAAVIRQLERLDPSLVSIRDYSVLDRVHDEMDRIRRDATGMHQAGFKSAGFKRRMKSRYLRTTAFLIARKKRAERRMRK